MNKMTINGRTVYFTAWRDQQAAERVAYDRSVKPQRVMLGDVDSVRPYIVCSPADAERMHRAGYEYA